MTVEESGVVLDHRRQLNLLRRNLWLIALLALLGAAYPAIKAVQNGIPHVATTQILVGEPVTLPYATGTQSGSTTKDTGRLVDAEQRRMQSDAVAKTVEATLPAGHASYDTQFSANTTTTNVVTVSVTSSDGDVAKKVADGIGKAYIDALSKYNTSVLDGAEKELDTSISDLDDQIDKLQKTLSSADPDSLAQVQAVVAPARQALIDRRDALQGQIDNVALVKSVGTLGGAQIIQEADVSPSLMAVATPIVIGLLLGAFLGFLLVWIREGLAGRIVDASDLEPAGITPKATWPAALDLPGPKTQFLPEVPRADVAEVRALAATMWPALGKGMSRDVTLLAPLTGQSIAPLTLAVWLARELDGMGHRVAVVNVDSASASSRSALSALTSRGGTGQAPLQGISTGHFGEVLVVDSGASEAVVGAPAFGTVLEQVSRDRDVVIVVGPALASQAGSIQAAPFVDRTVLLVKSGSVRRSYAKKVMDELRGYASTLPVLARPEVLLYDVRSVRPRTPAPDAPAASGTPTTAGGSTVASPALR
ncbi:MAG: hypothetical protein U0Q21_00630 [Dermatophilaceae bacterium]